MLKFDNLEGERLYDAWSAHANSKLFNVVLFTNRMARDFEGSGVTVNCLEPGWVFTDLAREGNKALQARKKALGHPSAIVPRSLLGWNASLAPTLQTVG
jgi:NAD(P)-dependent dehydrogenase (short-subunit alcohol dehydrogenase family)